MDKSTYDVVLYESHSYQKTHPDRLSALARLNGLTSPPMKTARVLELGASEGGNIIPMALVYPEAQFVGVDLAPVPVERGNKIIADLGLRNVRLEVMNVLDITPDYGQFDYMIAHGLYAWVPRIVQDKIMEIASRNLSPAGVAIISYNAYPGARFRETIRDYLMFHTRNAKTAEDKIAQARDLLRIVAEGRENAEIFDMAVQAEAAAALDRADSALFHDLMADCWAPSTIRDFVAHAGQFHLKYICDSSMIDTFNVPLTEAYVDLIRRSSNGDWVAQEQYADFFRPRRFRQSLLTHASNAISQDWNPQSLVGLYASSQAVEVAGPPAEFHFPFGGKVKADHEPTVKLLRKLIQLWPRSVAVEASEAPLMLDLFRRGIVDLSTWPGPAIKTSERPEVSALARYQVQFGHEVTSLTHQMVKLEGDLAAKLIALADGTRGVGDLASALNVPEPVIVEQIQNLGRVGLLVR